MSEDFVVMKKKDSRYEICFCGSGGQGIITAAVILAEAAGIYDGKFVCQTQSYGPESRGGACKSEVVISNEEIDYPKILQPDILLAMNQSCCDLYFLNLKPKGLLVVDATMVKQIPTPRAVAIPFTKIAKNEIGKEVVANIVALGAIVQLCQIVSIGNLEKALVARAPKGTADINLQALHAGIEAARQYDLNALPQVVMEEEE
jgi:2-oxoglutarate ferredoxin oxidoreductase subunit gamma